jgi:hypothetical protein
MDWTNVLPTETFEEVNQNNMNFDNATAFENDLNEDSDELNTPPESDDEEEMKKFPNYKLGEGINFQLTLKFNNKELIREAVKLRMNFVLAFTSSQFRVHGIII